MPNVNKTKAKFSSESKHSAKHSYFSVLSRIVLFCIALGPLVSSLSSFVISFPIRNISFLNHSLYNLIVICASLSFYYLLSPIHEYGHYYTAIHLSQNFQYKAHFWIGFSDTSCSYWNIFTPSECIQILTNGAKVKIIYCSILFTIALISGNYDISLIFGYTIILEYISNCTSLFPNSDYCKINELNKFYEEEAIYHCKTAEFFIKYIYFFMMISLTCVSIYFLFQKSLNIHCIALAISKHLLAQPM